MNVWTYWEGPRTPFIDVCLRSMEQVCTDGTTFHLVTPETVHDVVGDLLHPSYRDIQDIGIKTGAIRVAILAAHGGFWWDADTIGLRNPAALKEQYPNASVLYTTWDRPPLRATNGYIYMLYRCAAVQDWLYDVNDRVANERPLIWTELGERLLTPLLVQVRTAWRVSRDIFLPIDVDSNVEAFFEPGDPQDWITPTTVCFGMNQSWFWCHKRAEMEKAPEQWHDSPLLIHRLLSQTLARLGAVA